MSRYVSYTLRIVFGNRHTAAHVMAQCTPDDTHQYQVLSMVFLDLGQCVLYFSKGDQTHKRSFLDASYFSYLSEIWFKPCQHESFNILYTCNSLCEKNIRWEFDTWWNCVTEVCLKVPKYNCLDLYCFDFKGLDGTINEQGGQ